MSSAFNREDSRSRPRFVSDGDIIYESDRDQDGVGDHIFRTGGVERARITASGLWTGVISTSLPLNVKDYGAKVDGVTDDYVAINSALQAAKTAGGGIVLVPLGTCRFSQKILVPEGVWFRGVGMSNVANTNHGTTLKPLGINSDACIQPEKIDATQESFQISDFTLDLNATGTLTGCGIDVRGVFNDTWLRNIFVTNNAHMSVPAIRYAPATATDGLGAVLTQNCHVTPHGSATGILVTDNVTGTEVNAIESLCFVNCSVEQSNASPAWHFQTSYGSRFVMGMTLIGCRARSDGGSAAGSGFPVLIEGCKGITCIGLQVGTTAGQQAIGVRITNDANSNAALAHSFLNVISLSGVTAGISDATVGFISNTGDVKLYTQTSGVDASIHPIYFPGNGAALRVQADGRDFVVGKTALATTATAGFFFAPSTAGTPTGVPASTYNDAVPIVVDTAASKLWVRIGGTWKSVALT